MWDPLMLLKLRALSGVLRWPDSGLTPKGLGNMAEAFSVKAVGVVCSNSVSYLNTVFSCYEEGKVVVPLRGLDFAKKLRGVELTEIVEPQAIAGWFERPHSLSSSRDLAQITYTSGTEGEPKGIALSHEALSDVIHRLQRLMQLEESIREYVGVPVPFSFGFGRFRACAAAGGRAYIPENGFNPLEIAEMLRAGDINAISAVPTLWRIVLRAPELIGELGRHVRWIEIGSQYMSRSEKEQMKELFPKACIVQHYGLTEASRTSLLHISRTEGPMLESVGKAFGDTEIRVSEKGRIQIRGPHVTMGRVTEDGLIPLVDSEGWFTTADMGSLEGDYLFFHGRADDAINCAGIKLFPEQIEERLCRRLGVKGGLAVARVPDELRGEAVLIALLPDFHPSRDEVRSAAIEIVADFGVNAPDAVVIQGVQKLPTTETGKVKRRLLTEQFASLQAENSRSVSDHGPQESEDLTPEQADLVNVWEGVLGIAPISIHTSFYDLGGDSLSALRLMIRLEKSQIPRSVARDILNGRTIAEITEKDNANDPTEAVARQSASMQHSRRASLAINAVRGLLVLLVIGVHWLPWFFQRLPSELAVFHDWLFPVYRMGTPGFAIVFGIGVGFFLFPQFVSGSPAIRKNMWFALRIIGLGILVLAIFRLSHFLLSQESPTAPWLSALLWSVLAYYFLAILSLPLWWRMLSRFEDKVVGSVVVSVCFLSVNQLIQEFLPNLHGYFGGPMHLLQCILEANYNYFFMTGVVFMGIATGIFLQKNIGNASSRCKLGWVGLSLFLAGILITFDSGIEDQWFTRYRKLWSVITYLGFVHLMLAGGLRLAASKYNRGRIMRAYGVLSTIGVLALPAFVGHEVVIPATNSLKSLGAPYALAIGIPTAAFLGAFSFLVIRVRSAYYSV